MGSIRVGGGAGHALAPATGADMLARVVGTPSASTQIHACEICAPLPWSEMTIDLFSRLDVCERETKNYRTPINTNVVQKSSTPNRYECCTKNFEYPKPTRKVLKKYASPNRYETFRVNMHETWERILMSAFKRIPISLLLGKLPKGSYWPWAICIGHVGSLFLGETAEGVHAHVCMHPLCGPDNDDNDDNGIL